MSSVRGPDDRRERYADRNERQEVSMTERRDQPVTGDVIESGDVRMHGWEWSEVPGAPSRSRNTG